MLEAKTPGSAVLDGQGGRRVLDISSGSHPVTLKGVRVTGGVSEYNGGGARIKNGNVIWQHCTIHNNFNTGKGSGIFISNGNVTFTDCTFFENGNHVYDFLDVEEAYGGAVAVQGGHVRLHLCSIYNNRGNKMGAGAYVEGGTVTFTTCDINGNAANEVAGGASIDGGVVSFIDCDIHGNAFSNEGKVEGGGLFVGNGIVIVTGCAIYNNAATLGGGAYIDGGQVTFNNCEINGNEAEANGGGACIYDGRVAFNNCNFHSNSFRKRGGGACIGGGTVTFTACNIHNSKIKPAPYVVVHGGGGLFISNGTVTSMYCSIQNNTAKHACGLLITDGQVAFNGCSICSNSFSPSTSRRMLVFSQHQQNDVATFTDQLHVGGGGAYLSGGRTTFNNCNIHDNEDVPSYPGGYEETTYGGGVIIWGAVGGYVGAVVTFSNCDIHNNKADNGAGVRVNGGAATFIDCNIYDNKASASGKGGGAYVLWGTVDFINCVITANSAQEGGGVYIAGPWLVPSTSLSTAVTFNGSNIYGNTAWRQTNPSIMHGGDVWIIDCECITVTGTDSTATDCVTGTPSVSVLYVPDPIDCF